MIADDRRTFCDLRSAIRDPRSSAIIWRPAFIDGGALRTRNHALKELSHGLRILKSLASIFQIRRL